MLTTATKRIAPPQRLMYGPGPSMVDPRAYEAMAQPIVGIRDPYFLELMSEIQSGLRDVFGTRNENTFVVPAGGSGAMECAIANFVRPGSKFAIFAAGHFADRMTVMAKRQGANVVRLEKPWGEVFVAEEAMAFLERERPEVIGFVQAETSTGAYQSGRAIAPAARKLGALVIADCVTSLGAMPVELDAVGIDVAFSCSQKGLSCPAGLSPISVSPKAWEWLEKRPEEPSSWYLDLRLMSKYFEAPHVYHHTPSPPLYYAMHQALAVIEEEGLKARWERHRQASERLITGLVRLGFEPLVKKPEDRIWHMTTVVPPSKVNEAKLRENLLTKYNIEVAGGLGQLTSKILRIGTMGPLATSESVDFLLDSLQASI
ncbi:MAG: alanine--glyoxylate aminotransferase family protein [Acidobacteriaceae bacterium]|nr:alanine--glyoxylate aminotransferase family protein [Acidobacteriaceae bacterium]